MTAERWAARLAAGERIAAPIAIVVAHADDETLFAGPLLSRADDALLIHVTDSAPRDMTDARRLGFATRAGYVAARAMEVDAALSVRDAHDIVERVERALRDTFPRVETLIHLDPEGHVDTDNPLVEADVTPHWFGKRVGSY